MNCQPPICPTGMKRPEKSCSSEKESPAKTWPMTMLGAMAAKKWHSVM